MFSLEYHISPVLSTLSASAKKARRLDTDQTRGIISSLIPSVNWAIAPQENAKMSLADKVSEGRKRIAALPLKKSSDIAGSRLSIGFETLDRELFDPERTLRFSE
jgi:hypothetical protein